MVKSNKIYLDYAASVEPNPSSMHSFGVDAKMKLQNARSKVAEVLNAHRDEIIFTSGGTESNNLAIQGVVLALQKNKNKMLPHIITTNIEHSSVLETFKLLEKRGLAQISIVGVETNGIVDPKKIKKEIKENTVLVSVMYANNEIGTIQPIKEIAKEIRHWTKGRKGKNPVLPIFHTDAVQAANYLDLNVEKLGVDLLSLSGSKIVGAGKFGVLYKKKSVPLANIFGGGDQEFGFRPGTENLAEILKFSKAFKLAQTIKEKESKRLVKLRDYFMAELKNKNQKFSRVLGSPTHFSLKERAQPDQLENFGFDFLINGDWENRLPNNINITIPNIPSDLLVIELSARGIMASAKSACKSGDGKASHVIQAINPKIKDTDGSLRFSLGRQTTKSDVDYTVITLSKILTKLKKWY